MCVEGTISGRSPPCSGSQLVTATERSQCLGEVLRRHLTAGWILSLEQCWLVFVCFDQPCLNWHLDLTCFNFMCKRAWSRWVSLGLLKEASRWALVSLDEAKSIFSTYLVPLWEASTSRTKAAAVYQCWFIHPHSLGHSLQLPKSPNCDLQVLKIWSYLRQASEQTSQTVSEMLVKYQKIPFLSGGTSNTGGHHELVSGPVERQCGQAHSGWGCLWIRITFNG